MCVRDADVKKIDHIMDKVKLAPQAHTAFKLINFILSSDIILYIVNVLTAFPVGFLAGLFGLGRPYYCSFSIFYL